MLCNRVLTKSKLELLLEAERLGIATSNLDEENGGLDTEKKVQVSLTLANLTYDVNHLLTSLIYLARSIKKSMTEQAPPSVTLAQ